LEHLAQPDFGFGFAVTHPLKELDRTAIGSRRIDKGHAHTILAPASLDLVIKLRAEAASLLAGANTHP
jgi:hypothetical protein